MRNLETKEITNVNGGGLLTVIRVVGAAIANAVGRTASSPAVRTTASRVGSFGTGVNIGVAVGDAIIDSTEK